MRKSGGFFRRNKIGFKLLENLILWSSGKTSISTSRYIRILNMTNLLLKFSVDLNKFIRIICLRSVPHPSPQIFCSICVQNLPPYSYFLAAVSVFIFSWKRFSYFHIHIFLAAVSIFSCVPAVPEIGLFLIFLALYYQTMEWYNNCRCKFNITYKKQYNIFN